MGIIRRAIRVKLSSILKGTKEKKSGKRRKTFGAASWDEVGWGGKFSSRSDTYHQQGSSYPKKVLEIEYPIFKGQFSYMGWRKLWHFYVVINRVFCCTASFLSGDKLLRSMIHKMAAVVARGPRIQSWPIRLLLWRNSLPSFPSLLFWLRQKMAILLYCTRCQAPSHSIPFRSEISPYQKWNSVRGIFNSHKPWLQRITSRKQSTFSWEKIWCAW